MGLDPTLYAWLFHNDRLYFMYFFHRIQLSRVLNSWMNGSSDRVRVLLEILRTDFISFHLSSTRFTVRGGNLPFSVSLKRKIPLNEIGAHKYIFNCFIYWARKTNSLNSKKGIFQNWNWEKNLLFSILTTKKPLIELFRISSQRFFH